MISLESARKLKRAGLTWNPILYDFFGIPDRDLDEHVFVISDVQATIETIFRQQVVSFQGASEWALDSLIKSEAVWLPREDQLRDILEILLLKTSHPGIKVTIGIDGYRINIVFQDQKIEFSDKDASEAYAKAVLFIFGQGKSNKFQASPEEN